MKEELIEALKRLGMGRLDAAQTVADLLMPDQLTFGEVTQATTAELIERFDGPATVEIEVPAESKIWTASAVEDTSSWPGKDKDEYDAFFKPPAKPKRKKA